MLMIPAISNIVIPFVSYHISGSAYWILSLKKFFPGLTLVVCLFEFFGFRSVREVFDDKWTDTLLSPPTISYFSMDLLTNTNQGLYAT